MGLKLHPRTSIVTDAEIEIGGAILKAAEKYSLTPTEICSILIKELLRWNTYILRIERHGDASKKADEE